ncbi:hypothetical protein IMZ48_41590 [Candidatus Bathyarchaeota archaeon]|nr:hypothetical protein [Candidatus Bathyarchaeota archaeon]
MAPPSSSAAERHYHPNGRAAVAATRSEKPPGTPRRDKSNGRESLAMQDPGLKDYVSPCLPPYLARMGRW